MPRSPIAADFTHVDACIDAARAGTVEAWVNVLRLPVSEAILSHAGVRGDEFVGLVIQGQEGKTLPSGIAGYLARKALRSGDAGLARFVHSVREASVTLIREAAGAAAACLPATTAEPEDSSTRRGPEVIRFAGFAFADAFSPGDPIINLGDFYFSVYQKIAGDESVREDRTLNLIRRVIAHELHHAGLGPILGFPKTRNGEWLMKMIISEGVATLLMLPFTEDDAYYYTNWQNHTDRFGDYLKELPSVVEASREQVPDDIMRRWVMNVGACYYVGATMASAIEDVFGREQLVKSLADVDAFFRAYDEAAQEKSLPRVEGM